MDKNDEVDIYRELSSIKTNHISHAGREFQKMFGNRCIKGFLHQKVLKNQLSKKISQNKYQIYKRSTPKKISEELNQLANDSLTISPRSKDSFDNDENNNNKTIEAYPDDFCGFIKRLKEKKEKEKLEEEEKKRQQQGMSNKKYEVSPELINYIKSQRKKIPPCCMYNPNYNAIAPHVPLVKLQPLKEKKDSRSKSVEISISHNSSSVPHKQNKNRSVIQSSITKKEKSIQSYHVMSFDKYSSRNDLAIKQPYNDTSLEPNKIKRNVYVPNFKKMISRNQKLNRSNQRLPCLMNYTPNYNAIYINNKGYNRGNKELYRKKTMIKKIWGSFDATSRYIVVPSMNNKN